MMSGDGMTRLELAARAMQGMCANPGGPLQANSQGGWGYCNGNAATLSAEAFALADAMLAASGEPAGPELIRELEAVHADIVAGKAWHQTCGALAAIIVRLKDGGCA